MPKRRARIPLSTHEYGDGTLHPAGYVNVESFELDGALPVWRFAVADQIVERRVWMPQGRNATWISYRLARGELPMELEVVPLATWRDFHTLAPPAAPPGVEVVAGGLAVRFDGAAATLTVSSTGGVATAFADRYRDFLHREETARGLDDRSDAFGVGAIRLALRPGEIVGVLFSVDPDPECDLAEGPAASLARARARQAELIERADAVAAEPAIQQLVLAADQFLVDRPRPATRRRGRSSPATTGSTTGAATR